MKVTMEDTCTACGLCVGACPEVFEMGDEMARVIADPVPETLEEQVTQTADQYPVEAVTVEWYLAGGFTAGLP